MFRRVCIVVLVPLCVLLGYGVLGSDATSKSRLVDFAFVGAVLLFLTLLVVEMGSRITSAPDLTESRPDGHAQHAQGKRADSRNAQSQDHASA